MRVCSFLRAVLVQPGGRGLYSLSTAVVGTEATLETVGSPTLSLGGPTSFVSVREHGIAVDVDCTAVTSRTHLLPPQPAPRLSNPVGVVVSQPPPVVALVDSPEVMELASSGVQGAGKVSIRVAGPVQPTGLCCVDVMC